jgi:hypothetical protein
MELRNICEGCRFSPQRDALRAPTFNLIHRRGWEFNILAAR